MRVSILFAFVVQLLNFTDVFSQNPVKPPNPALQYLNNVRDLCVSDDGREWYFTVQSPDQDLSQIVMIRKTGKTWSKPALLPFSGPFQDMEPFLSPNQKRLYFASNRTESDTSNTPKDFDIWYVERLATPALWSAKPVNAGPIINTAADEFYPSLSGSGTLYFTSVRPEGAGEDDIYEAVWNGTSYEKPTPLPAAVNDPGYDANAFISRDGTFLLFSKYRPEGGSGSWDLMISRKQNDGAWSTAQNLGPEINSNRMDYCPFYHEPSGILYFTSRRNALQPARFNDFEQYQSTLNSYQNGLSRIYSVQLDLK